MNGVGSGLPISLLNYLQQNPAGVGRFMRGLIRSAGLNFMPPP